MQGKKIEEFILFEGGISLPPFKLSREILENILQEIDFAEALGEGM